MSDKKTAIKHFQSLKPSAAFKQLDFSKLPKEEDRKGRNILHIQNGKATIYLDVFKTRHRVKNNKEKDLMPAYIKELPAKLTELLIDYIKKAGIKDNSKRTRQEVKDNVQFYVFHVEKENQTVKYQKSGFSRAISAAMKEVYDKKDLSTNTLRHAFNTWVAEHLEEFTDQQLQQISIDVGDTPRMMPTNLRYRIAQQGNKGLDVTEIQDAVHDNEYARKVMQGGMEEAASVGNVEQQDMEEVISPTTTIIPKSADEIIDRIGELHKELARLNFALSKI